MLPETAHAQGPYIYIFPQAAMKALQIAGSVLLSLTIAMLISLFSSFFFEHVIREREFWRIVTWSVVLSLYGMFCKSAGLLAAKHTKEDGKYNRTITGGAFVLAIFFAFTEALSLCKTGEG